MFPVVWPRGVAHFCIYIYYFLHFNAARARCRRACECHVASLPPSRAARWPGPCFSLFWGVLIAPRFELITKPERQDARNSTCFETHGSWIAPSSEGCSKSVSGSSSVVQTHGGDRLKQHRVSRALDSENCFTWCARSKVGLRAGPATPHRNRAYGHETSPQRGCCSPVRCLDRRPQAQDAPNTTARPRWSGRTGR